jgi:hypothetical protein
MDLCGPIAVLGLTGVVLLLVARRDRRDSPDRMASSHPS